MSSNDVIRLLAQQGDPQALLALRKQAARENDQLLLDYTEQVAQREMNTLRRLLSEWQLCLGYGPALILVSYGQKKIQAIKEVRVLTGLGLKEAKAMVDHTPVVVVKEIKDPVQAERAIKAFKEIGYGCEAVWADPGITEMERKIFISREYAVSWD